MSQLNNISSINVNDVFSKPSEEVTVSDEHVNYKEEIGYDYLSLLTCDSNDSEGIGTGKLIDNVVRNCCLDPSVESCYSGNITDSCLNEIHTTSNKNENSSNETHCEQYGKPKDPVMNTEKNFCRNSPPRTALVDEDENIKVFPDVLNETEHSQVPPTLQKIDGDRSIVVNGHNDSDLWTDDESSSSTSSSDSDFFLEEMRRSSTPKTIVIKTKGELDVEDLPPIEDLSISVNEKELTKIGTIHAIVISQVVVLALKDHKPLDLDSVLFLSPDKPLGRIFDVFGPVVEPFYLVRFNSPKEIIEKGVIVDAEVYFAPKKSDITSFVFVDVLRLQKGSDASWKDNNEPPEEYLDYSDDEQERAAKQKRLAKNRARDDEDEVQIISNKKAAVGTVQRVAVVQSRRNDVSLNYNAKKFQPQGHLFRSHSTENVFRRSYNPETTQGKSFATANNKSSFNRSSSAHSSTPLDGVPVWITSPPPYLQPVPSSPLSMANSQSPAPLHSQQPASLPYQQQIQNNQRLNSNILQQRFRSAPLVLFPKQPFVPRLPPNLRSPPPQPLIYHNVPQNMTSQAPVFQSYSQPHVFGQVTSVGTISPAVSFPLPVFSPCPPSAVLSTTPDLSANYFNQSFVANSPPMSETLPHHYWQHREPPRSPFLNAPPSAPLSIQIPSFSTLPPLVRFNAANDPPIPPPQPLPNRYNQFHSAQNRF